MGGSLQYAITGGANLGERLGFLLRRHRLDGHGGLRTHGDHRVGTFKPRRQSAHRISGTADAGTAVRIADDGEIWLRAYVMAAYHNNATATAEVINADDWLRTGDIGEPRLRWVPADHWAQEGDHRHRWRQERRPGGAGGSYAGRTT